MVLSQKIIDVVEHNIDVVTQVFTEISPKPEGLKEWGEKWNYHGDDIYSFIHGYLTGSIQEASFTTARTLNMKALDGDERKQILEIAEQKIEEITDIVSRLKNA